MNTPEPQPHNHNHFGGATFNGAQNFAPGGTAHVTNATHHSNSTVQAIVELRTAVADLHASLQNIPESSPDLDEARWRTEELADELTADQPRPEQVQKRWQRLKPLVPTLTAAGSIATITNLVKDLV